jgi:hypothetical protein
MGPRQGGAKRRSGGICVVALAVVTAAVGVDAVGAEFSNPWIVLEPDPGISGGLYSISCVAPSTCVAVGTGGLGAAPLSVVATRGGNGWSVAQPRATGVPGERLASIACTSAVHCIAVGYDGDSATGPRSAIARRWDGNEWSALTPDVPDDAASSSLNKVACESALNCVAVGFVDDASHARRAIVERWTGTQWSIVPSPSVARLVLDDVSCPVSSACMVVGYQVATDAEPSRPFTATLEGETWSIHPTPSLQAGLESETVINVSCVAADACVAIGRARNPAYVPFALKWDGVAWSLISDGLADGGDQVISVSCTGPTLCHAVGITTDFFTADPVVHRWNGGAWTIVDARNFELQAGLNEISCFSPEVCVAVGFAAVDISGAEVLLMTNDNSVVDLAVPAVAIDRPTSRVTTKTSIAVSWSGQDPSGIHHFDVRRRSTAWNASAARWVTWKSATTTASATYAGVHGRTYCFSARAQDGMNNLSSWSSPRCTAVPLRSDQLSRSSGWSRATRTDYFAGFAYSTTKAGAKMTRTDVVAERLYLVATTCSSCGSVQVRWNGALLKTVSLRSGSTARRQVLHVHSFSSARPGTVTITTTNGKRVIVEGLGVYNA